MADSKETSAPSAPVDDVAVVKGADVSAPHDAVLAVSRYADGTPRQSPGFKSVDPEATAAISERQLREMHVSAADHAIRSALAKADEGESKLDPLGQALKDAHDKAAKAGESAAKSEKVEGV